MNLGGLDLNLLVALDALLSERSVTRAAQRVGLSQPGMSNALGRLRRLFDDPLLVRQGATLVPTARAEALVGPVHEALELIRGALDAPARLRPRDRPPRVPPELLGLQRADAHRPARARARRRRARARRRGPAAAGRRRPGAAQRRRRPRHRAAGDHGRRRPRVAAPVGRPLGMLRLGGQHARGQAHDPGALHRARAPHLLDGRRAASRSRCPTCTSGASASRAASR